MLVAGDTPQHATFLLLWFFTRHAISWIVPWIVLQTASSPVLTIPTTMNFYLSLKPKDWNLFKRNLLRECWTCRARFDIQIWIFVSSWLTKQTQIQNLAIPHRILCCIILHEDILSQCFSFCIHYSPLCTNVSHGKVVCMYIIVHTSSLLERFPAFCFLQD
jgi:hypothetical protein